MSSNRAGLSLTNHAATSRKVENGARLCLFPPKKKMAAHSHSTWPADYKALRKSIKTNILILAVASLMDESDTTTA
jgi:hypothetical protein